MSTITLIPIAIFIIAIIIWILMINRNKKAKAGYLSQYPNAAKIFLSHKGLLFQSHTQILAVNGETPALFRDSDGYGVYCKPGFNTLTIINSSIRPGVLDNSVTNSTNEVTLEAEIQANTEYIVAFDKETNTCKIYLR